MVTDATDLTKSMFCGVAEDILSAVSEGSDAPVGAILSCVSQKACWRTFHPGFCNIHSELAGPVAPEGAFPRQRRLAAGFWARHKQCCLGPEVENLSTACRGASPKQSGRTEDVQNLPLLLLLQLLVEFKKTRGHRLVQRFTGGLILLALTSGGPMAC